MLLREIIRSSPDYFHLHRYRSLRTSDSRHSFTVVAGMDLNHILNTEPGWKGGRPSLHRPKPMECTTGEFTTGSHDPATHQKSHRVNAYSLQPQSEHKRNDTVYSLPPISSFDGPPRSLPHLDFRSYQYEPEQLRCSFPSYSSPRQSDLYAVQPRTSSVPTAYASDLYRIQPRTSSLPTTYASPDSRSSSADNSLTLRDLHIRPPRGVFDPSFSFQGGESRCYCCALNNTTLSLPFPLSLTHQRDVKSIMLTILQSTPISIRGTNLPSSQSTLVWYQLRAHSETLIAGLRAPISIRDTNLPSSQSTLVWYQLRTHSETLIAELTTLVPTALRPRPAPERSRRLHPSRWTTSSHLLA